MKNVRHSPCSGGVCSHGFRGGSGCRCFHCDPRLDPGSPCACSRATFLPGLRMKGAQVAGRLLSTLDPRVEPRVRLRGGFAVTLWTYYDPLQCGIAPPEYAQALLRLHASMRRVEMTAPHFTDRVVGARSLLDDGARTPELGDADRELLNKTLQSLTATITNHGADEQLLHGEPHPDNLLHPV